MASTPPKSVSMSISIKIDYNNTLCIDVPSDIAKKLKANEDLKWGEPWSWYIKWATLYYCDGDGKECEIKGDTSEFDYKRDSGYNWDDCSESESEPEPKSE